jgi:hypothetical protein
MKGMSYVRKTNWTGHILHGNYLVKHIIAGKTEGQKDNEEDISS